MITAVAFTTDNLVETCADLEAKGVRILEQPEVAPWGAWWARISDSEGNEIGMGQREDIQ